MRILGLDIGKKKIGVAVSDEGALTAQPLLVIKRVSIAKDMAELVRLVTDWSVERIVAGLPLNMDGTESSTTEFVRNFLERLAGATDCPIVTWDERLSTVAVERLLIEGDVSRERRREVVDKMAASYILQGYLDSLRHGAG